MNRRKVIDIQNLFNSKKMKIVDENDNLIEEFINLDKIYLIISGPKDTIYYNWNWKINIEIPKEYPYKSPSVGFVSNIYHPNVDLESGTICLDALNETWSPIYTLNHIIEIFLPQLLTYPNCDDPLNIEAADLMQNNLQKYNKKVKEFNEKYALTNEYVNHLDLDF